MASQAGVRGARCVLRVSARALSVPVSAYVMHIPQPVAAVAWRKCGRGPAPPCARWHSQTAGGGQQGMVDVQGGKIEDDSRAEGHLIWAERAKNIVAAHRRFQLTTYNRLPEDHNDQDSIHTDTQRAPVTGFLHKERNCLVIMLHSDTPSHQKHAENVSKIATASVSVGHLDPVQLVPIFTRVGLMPPVVRVLGDLVPIDSKYEVEIRAAMRVAPDAGSLYWLEPGGIFFEDIFSERTQVSVRDFRSAFIDPLALQQFDAIHIANTKFLDYLPKFCRDFLGVPVEEAYLYSVDRAGCSVFALRDGTDDKWREYRFPFQDEVRKYEGFVKVLEAMQGEVEEAEA